MIDIFCFVRLITFRYPLNCTSYKIVFGNGWVRKQTVRTKQPWCPIPTALDQTKEYKLLVNTQRGARLMEAFTDLNISLVQQLRICPLLLFGLRGGLLGYVNVRTNTVYKDTIICGIWSVIHEEWNWTCGITFKCSVNWNERKLSKTKWCNQRAPWNL